MGPVVLVASSYLPLLLARTAHSSATSCQSLSNYTRQTCRWSTGGLRPRFTQAQPKWALLAQEGPSAYRGFGSATKHATC